MDLEWNETYKIIVNKHDDAYKTIELAIKSEEEDNPELALINYKLGISLIDEALATPVALPDDPSEIDETWERACKIIHKMKRTRGEVLQRVATLSMKHSPNSLKETATCINEDIGDGHHGRPRTYTELAAALGSMQYDENGSKSSDALELLFSCEGVKLYHIKSTGEVTTTSEDSILRIVSLAEDSEKNLLTTFFIQIIMSSQATVIEHLEINFEDTSSTNMTQTTLDYNRKFDNSWIYPLVLGASPCYRTDYGAFIFPDLYSNNNGAAVGIVVPPSSDDVLLEIFEALLHGIAKQTQDNDDEEMKLKRSRRRTSDAVSENIVKGAYYISKGLVRGSEKVGEFVTYSTPYIMSKLRRAPKDTPPVSENVITGIEIAKSATSVAANVTGYIAGKVGSTTLALGRFLAPHVQKQGSRLLSTTMGYSQEKAVDKMSDVLTIAAGAVEGFGTVYSGLEESAAVLGKNLSNNSVKIIEHKYGVSAGTVATGTFDTVGNIINLSQNVNYMTPKGLAKKTAKNAGKAIIQDYKPKVKGVNYIPAGSLYPNLSEFSKTVTKQT